MGMEELTAGEMGKRTRNILQVTTVDRVPNQGMTNRFQVDSDLVGPSRL